MDAAFGSVPLPEEGTEAYEAWIACEECNVTTCRGDAPNPFTADAMYGFEPWCPGHCRRFAWLALGAGQG